jgi:hypothetical protein
MTLPWPCCLLRGKTPAVECSPIAVTAVALGFEALSRVGSGRHLVGIAVLAGVAASAVDMYLY